MTDASRLAIDPYIF